MAAPTLALHTLPDPTLWCSEQLCMAAESPSDSRSPCPTSAGNTGLSLFFYHTRHPSTSAGLDPEPHSHTHPLAMQEGPC